MAKFNTDYQDAFFTLFDVLKADQRTQDMEAGDLKEIVTQLGNFSENEIWPNRVLSDEQGCQLTDEGVKAPESLRKGHEAFYANGWFGLGLPEEIGGMPVPEAVNIACQSILNGCNTAWAMYPGLTRAALSVVLAKGSQAQKDMIVPKMIEGRWGGTMCLTEPGAGSDVGAVRTTATPNDDGSYNIKGIKIFISSGENDLYENIIHLVLAKTPNAPEGTKGISLFIVPRYLHDDQGNNTTANDVVATKIEEKMGIHANATCEMTFGQNGDCKGWLISEEFDGMASMFIMMNEARLLCGLQGEGQAHMAYELALNYAKERSQFGTEIVNLPDVKRQLLRMRVLTRGMRALCLYTADLFDQAREDQQLHNVIALLTPVCKAYCSEVGFDVSVEAVQVHGGYGYCTEYGVEQFIRDTKIATIYEGTNGIQAIDFMTRKFLKEKGESLTWIAGEIQKRLTSLDGEFASEQKLFTEVLGQLDTVTKNLGAMAAGKQMGPVMAQCNSFLLFCSQMIVAWRLMESAQMAVEKLPSASNDQEKQFLESKKFDFKFYCSQFLVTNLSIGRSMTEGSWDLEGIVL